MNQIGKKLIFFAIFTFLSVSNYSYAKAPPPPSVVVESVKPKPVNPYKKYVGHIEPIQTVDIQARVSGYLEKVCFKEGSYVHEGDVLYIIEQEPYEAQVKARKAQLEEAKANLYWAKKHLKRLRSARPESIPATEMDKAIADEWMARAKVMEAEASLELAKINLGYTTIKAPITGLMGKTFLTAGNLVGPEKGPLARLVQIEPIRVVYSLSEPELVDLQKRMAKDKSPLKVRIRLPNGSLYGEWGRLDFISNEVDPETGTIAVYILFQNKDHMLRPGEYVDVLVYGKSPKMMITVPQKAVLTDQKGHYVLVVDKNGKVEERRVTLGPQTSSDWAITSGLSPGDNVIVEGIQKVKPGQIVKPIKISGRN